MSYYKCKNCGENCCVNVDNAKLKEAAEFALMTLEHAIHLDYLGEGSTRGMALDAIQKLSQVCASQVSSLEVK